MKILDMAMQKEKEAEQYYRELAEKSPDKGLANILIKLASVELKHFEALKHMRDDGEIQFDESDPRAEFKTLFETMAETVKSFDFDISQVDMYKIAQDRETEAQMFYEQQADQAGSAAATELFRKLAAQEHNHYQILDTIIEFVSRAEPGNWLENAEWCHREEY